MAVLHQYDRLKIESALTQSGAVFAGCAPAFAGDEGSRAAARWRQAMEQKLA